MFLLFWGLYIFYVNHILEISSLVLTNAREEALKKISVNSNSSSLKTNYSKPNKQLQSWWQSIFKGWEHATTVVEITSFMNDKVTYVHIVHHLSNLAMYFAQKSRMIHNMATVMIRNGMDTKIMVGIKVTWDNQLNRRTETWES